MDRFDIREQEAVTKVIASGELSRFFTSFRGGKYVQEFEQAFADYLGVNHAVSVSNGTVSLEIALQAMGIKRGQEVITTPLSFIATGTAILRVGAKPVFVDVEPESLCIDPDKIEEAITKHTRAIIPVSLNGMPCFAANTLIATLQGLISISNLYDSQLKYVIGYKNGKLVSSKIYGISKTFCTGSIFIVQTDNAVTRATGEHPFWIRGKGWVRAKSLKKEMLLSVLPNNTYDSNDEKTIVDFERGADTERDLSDSIVFSGNYEKIAKIQMAADKRQGSRDGSKRVLRLKEQNCRNEAISCSSSVSRWLDRWRRNDFHISRKKILSAKTCNLEHEFTDGCFLEGFEFQRNRENEEKVRPIATENMLCLCKDRICSSSDAATSSSLFTLQEGAMPVSHRFHIVSANNAFEHTKHPGTAHYLHENLSLEWEKIISISQVPFIGYVYNIMTNTDNYFANNALVHNCRMYAINSIAQEHNLLVLEDAAQALGASIDRQKIGSYGNAGSFSFQESKTISTLGEGGMIVTDDLQIAERARNIRNHGNVYGTMRDATCTNARMTEAAAAFGIVQLQKLDQFNKLHKQNGEYFLTHLKPPFGSVWKYPTLNGYKLSYYLLPVAASQINRERFIQYTKDCGLSKGVPGSNVGYWKRLITDVPIFSRYNNHSYPNAEWAQKNVYLFDIHRWRSLDPVKKALQQTLAYPGDS